MKTRNSAKILGLLALVLGIVAICFWFGPAFDNAGHPYNLMQTAFAIEDHGYPTVWTLVIAFVILIIGSLLGAIVPYFRKTGALVVGGLSFLCLLGGGIMTLLVKSFFLAVNPYGEVYSSFGLGSGTITSAVFAFLAAIFVLATLNLARKQD